MDPDRPTSTYRTPAAAEPAAPPSEVLGEFVAPMLGAMRVELGLGAPVGLIPNLADPKDLYGHLMADTSRAIKRAA